MQAFGVSVFLGQDQILRFVPGVRNKFGIYVPIPQGKELPLSSTIEAIGMTYQETAQISLSMDGTDLDMRKATPKFKAFRGFRSQKQFNSQHQYIWSFCENGSIRFIFMIWHNGEFVVLKSDIKCEKIISDDSDAATIGQTILDVFNMADSAYPEKHIWETQAQIAPPVSLDKNSTTLFVKGMSADFKNAVHMSADEDVICEKIRNDLYSFSSVSLSKLTEENLVPLQELAKKCDELYCFSAYTTVGLYSFFHYKNGKCFRGYSSLDEQGEVLYNIGEKSYAEKKLKLNLPPTTTEFAQEKFNDLTFRVVEQIAQHMVD